MNTNKEIFKKFIFRQIRGYDHPELQVIFLGHMAFDYLTSIEENFYTEAEMEQAKDMAIEEYLNSNKNKRFSVVDQNTIQSIIINNSKTYLFMTWLNSQSTEELNKYYNE
jgi:hypothetical protein